MRPFQGLLLPLLLSVSLAAPAFAGSVTVEGRGEVSAAPDTAFITSGVTTQAPTAREALDANSAAMQALIEELRDAGIAERDIQTSNFSVNPNYVYSNVRDDSGYTLPPRIDGYQVSNTVTVKVSDLDSLGVVLDRAVTVGANTIHGIGFSVAEPEDLYNEARRLAFADARAKAELYAGLAGESLGDIESIREGQSYSPPVPQYAVRAASADMESSVPIAGGELTFSITVAVEWDLD